MDYEAWHKLFCEVQQVALKGAKPSARTLYNYLRSLSPGFECEAVEGVTYEWLSNQLMISKTTVAKAIKELQKRGLIEKTSFSRGAGKVYFVFNYPGSTFTVSHGQVVI